MVDLTRDEHGRLHARSLDVVAGRSATAYAGWLKQQLPEFIAGIEHPALDPFRGYARRRGELVERHSATMASCTCDLRKSATCSLSAFYYRIPEGRPGHVGARARTLSERLPRRGLGVPARRPQRGVAHEGSALLEGAFGPSQVRERGSCCQASRRHCSRAPRGSSRPRAMCDHHSVSAAAEEAVGIR
jgi:hypothetical protein